MKRDWRPELSARDCRALASSDTRRLCAESCVLGVSICAAEIQPSAFPYASKIFKGSSKNAHRMRLAKYRDPGDHKCSLAKPCSIWQLRTTPTALAKYFQAAAQPSFHRNSIELQHTSTRVHTLLEQWGRGWPGSSNNIPTTPAVKHSISPRHPRKHRMPDNSCQASDLSDKLHHLWKKLPGPPDAILLIVIIARLEVGEAGSLKHMLHAKPEL